MEIKNPDDLEEVDPINSSVVIDDNLFLIKENSIYRMLTAETIDPENNHPDTRHSYEKIYDIGSSSPIVARVIPNVLKNRWKNPYFLGGFLQSLKEV